MQFLVEIREMFVHDSIYFFRTACLTAARGYLQMAVDFLKEVPCLKKKPYDFQCIMQEYVGFIWDEIIIFGCGLRGKSLYYELMGRGIQVNAFLDNNEKLYGLTIADIPCLPPGAFKENRTGILLIVSPEDSKGIIDQLSEMGFYHVITRNQLEELLLRYPPFQVEVFNNEMDE